MAASLWVRTIRHHRMDRQLMIPCTHDEVQEALSEACHQLDISRPIWLEKNSREWAEFSQTRFLPDAFLEPVVFERLEIEFVDPEAKKRRSQDPRNA